MEPMVVKSVNKVQDNILHVTPYSKESGRRQSPKANPKASMCLHDLIPQVVEIVYSESYRHRDVHIPNICFNENFTAVLIDLDNSKHDSHPTKTSGKDSQSGQHQNKGKHGTIEK